MKHFSLVKLIVALLICNVYVFSCVVSGTVTTPEVQVEEELPNEEDDLNKRGGTLDFIGEDDLISTGDLNTAQTVELVNLGCKAVVCPPAGELVVHPDSIGKRAHRQRVVVRQYHHRAPTDKR